MRAADFWHEALDPATYMARMTMNRELFERRIPVTEITAAERDAFGGLPLRILVLTEDFCGDSAQFIPPVVRLAQALENVEVRVLLRDEHRDLAASYLRKDGYQAIPVFILLGEDGAELGSLVERPARVYDELAAETRRFARENPQLEAVNRTYDKMPSETRAAVRANADSFRDSQQAAWTRWLFEDLAEIVASERARWAHSAVSARQAGAAIDAVP